MSKPGIIILSQPTDTTFQWASDGWHTIKQQNQPKAKALFAKATKQIEAGIDHEDVIKRLQQAGFEVRYANFEEEPWLKGHP